MRSFTHRTALALTCLGAIVASASMPAAAQIRGSERSTLSQVSDGTTVIIDYARPHVRGRRPVFPDLIEWGHVWTPGANSATTLATDRDVTINGVEVPAGTYSVWFVPREGAWTVALHPDPRLYHTQPPDNLDELIRMEVVPTPTEFTEALTWEFAQVHRDGMDLRFRWDDVRVDFRVEVPPTHVASTPPEQAEAIAGSYRLVFAPMPDMPDMPEGAGPPPNITSDFRFENGRLIGTMPAPGGPPEEFEMLFRADWIYNPGWMMDGEVFETELEMFFEFLIVDGVVSGFEVRGVVDDRIDRLMWSGERVR